MSGHGDDNDALRAEVERLIAGWQCYGPLSPGSFCLLRVRLDGLLPREMAMRAEAAAAGLRRGLPPGVHGMVILSEYGDAEFEVREPSFVVPDRATLVGILNELAHQTKTYGEDRDEMVVDFHNVVMAFIRRWGLEGDQHAFASMPGGHE